MPRPRVFNTETQQWDRVHSLQPYAEQGFYQHVQSTPATTWTVRHQLRRHPAIHIEDPVGNIVHASVQHISNDVVEINFAVPFTGTVYCN